MTATLNDPFTDTVFWLALVIRQDEHHARAQAWASRITGTITTTAAVLLETAIRDGKRILLEGDDELRDARLWLVDAIRQTLASGLAILGVKAPDAM